MNVRDGHGAQVVKSLKAIARRGTELVLSASALAATAPLQLGVAALILVEDGGPVFFVQERIGHRKEPFRMIKLRSMRGGRVTHVGGFLRATGLDEIPQFYCVLQGTMRIVGPRPLTRADLERLGWLGPDHASRFSVPPGITGLAQVVGGRSARHTRALDALYARKASPSVDAWIVGVSFLMGALGKDRVRRLLALSDGTPPCQREPANMGPRLPDSSALHRAAPPC